MNKKLIFVIYRFVIGILLPVIVVSYIVNGWKESLLFLATVLLWVFYEDLMELGVRVLGLESIIEEDETEQDE